MLGVCLSLNGWRGPIPMDETAIEIIAEFIDPFFVAFNDDDFVSSF
jgi:hypothetical protein